MIKGYIFALSITNKKLSNMTTTQKTLLEIASNYTSQNCPIKYDILKSLCNVKSFDSSFNALLRAVSFITLAF